MTVTGFVPDLRPHLSAAAVAICPIRVGAGIQNKALEAMAAGIPVVATPLVASGVGAGDEEMIRASSSAEFAKACIFLLSDRARAEEVGRRGQEFVRQRYSWTNSARTLEGVYGRAIARGAVAG